MIACHHHKFSLSWKILLMMNHIHRLDRQPLNGLLLTYTCPNLHHHFHSSPLWSREVQIHLYLCAPPCLSYHHCHTFVIVVLTMIDDHGLGGQRLEQNHKTRAMALVICKWCWRRVKATLKAITYYKWNHQKTNKGTKTFLSKAPMDYLLEDPQPLFLKVMFSLLSFAILLLLQMRNHYQFCNL